MTLNYIITISPFCEMDVIHFFDAIATKIKLYRKAKVFFDLRDGPLVFIPLNTKYSLILNENTGYLHDRYTATEAAIMIDKWEREGQIDKTFVVDNSCEKTIERNLSYSGVCFEKIESMNLKKIFSLDCISGFDYMLLAQMFDFEKRRYRIELPNFYFASIVLTKTSTVLLNGEEIMLTDLEKKIKTIELQFLSESQDTEDYSVNDLIELLGPTVMDEFQCYFNPMAKKSDYQEYKQNLLTWFLELDYHELSTYSGTNYVVGMLLAAINANKIILPKDYFKFFSKI